MSEKRIEYLHIGRTGGTSLRLMLQSSPDLSKYIHYNKHSVAAYNLPKDSNIIFCVRDPVERFISGFHQRKNKLVRHRLENAEQVWSRDEIEALDKYQSLDELLGCLFSVNKSISENTIRNLVYIMHIGLYGSYWYWFKNKTFLESNFCRIFYIVRHEEYQDDFKKLILKLGCEHNELIHARSSKATHGSDEDLMNKQKLYCFLRNEYVFIETLKEKELLPDDYLDKEIELSKLDNTYIHHAKNYFDQCMRSQYKYNSVKKHLKLMFRKLRG